MRIPTITGTIDRRILVNYRVDPDTLAKLLPSPFRPKLVHGFGMAGICLIRLKNIVPRPLPGFLGISSENAAHRFAVEWDQNGQTHQGVYIPRRDTSSRLNAFAGGRLFPGVHHHARFRVDEQEERYRLDLDSDDQKTHVAVQASIAAELPTNSIFSSLQEASDFFESGCVGYSDAAQTNEYDGLELRSFNWEVQPLKIERVESSYFEDQNLFPMGSIELDSALLMRGIQHEWIGRESLKSDPAVDCMTLP
ncbi:DUF2071 domain-containing protein [Blastopirellula sp. JC732]|uniref:DUF2071 domain-containing protein n=1 Tax=Blastopirellula sediminis TaxID=2894196 RepID=A0A9X1MIF7_9BACT|nr:DUF2071 domain-containing protein [Blastopirellula sediminis]MCC9609546.1 DUF2071 domain-containing protein [Blastopirellula sediminis]MCC9627678.1 DUF2071 domain-containing protein [Blastopirellula sediminis]